MEYNWLQALEMVANGQPMHDKTHECYIDMKNNSVYWIMKETNTPIDAIRIGTMFMLSTFEPYCKQIELTEDEKVILRNVDKQYNWICRDKGGSLVIFKSIPKKGTEFWISGFDFLNFTMYKHLFQDIKWEDAEPRLIADLIK